MSPAAEQMDGEAELSRAFVRHFWNSDLAWCQEYLSDDFVFFSDGSDTLVFDRTQLGQMLGERSFGRPARAILIGERYEVASESASFCVVNGSFLRFSDLGGTPSAVRTSSTFIWDRRTEPPRLRQYRASSTPCADNRTASDGTAGPSPIRKPGSGSGSAAGSNTGSGAGPGMGATKRTGKTDSAVSIRDVDGTMHRFARADVYSLEATGARTIIRTATSSITVRGCLTSIIGELRLDLVRVHRSFAVNPDHVRSLTHQTLVLDDGSQIKVPVKRLRHVKSDLFSKGE